MIGRWDVDVGACRESARGPDVTVASEPVTKTPVSDGGPDTASKVSGIDQGYLLRTKAAAAAFHASLEVITVGCYDRCLCPNRRGGQQTSDQSCCHLIYIRGYFHNAPLLPTQSMDAQTNLDQHCVSNAKPRFTGALGAWAISQLY